MGDKKKTKTKKKEKPLNGTAKRDSRIGEKDERYVREVDVESLVWPARVVRRQNFFLKKIETWMPPKRAK